MSQAYRKESLINIHGCKYCEWSRQATSQDKFYRYDAPMDSYLCRKIPPPFYPVSATDFCGEYERKRDRTEA